MDTNKICFSKRIMIVSLVGLVLVGLVFLSYSVSTKTTRTQAKADSGCNQFSDSRTLCEDTLLNEKNPNKRRCMYVKNPLNKKKYICTNCIGSKCLKTDNNKSESTDTSTSPIQNTSVENISSEKLNTCPSDCDYKFLNEPASGPYITCNYVIGESKPNPVKCCREPRHFQSENMTDKFYNIICK